MANTPEENQREIERSRANMEHAQNVSRKAGQEQRRHQEEMNSKIGSGGNGCFPAGTLIHTPNGTRDISELRRGDLVMSLDKVNNRLISNRILSVKTHTKNRLWKLRFNDGTSLKTTPIHSFLVDGTWRKAKDIRESDSVTVIQPDQLCSIKKIDESRLTESCEDVYNLIIDKNFNFIADGVLAHSFSRFRTLRSAMYSLNRMVPFKTALPTFLTNSKQQPA